MQIDPRTVAREIPGVLNEVFPQLTPGIVAHFNASAESPGFQDGFCFSSSGTKVDNA